MLWCGRWYFSFMIAISSFLSCIFLLNNSTLAYILALNRQIRPMSPLMGSINWPFHLFPVHFSRYYSPRHSRVVPQTRPQPCIGVKTAHWRVMVVEGLVGILDNFSNFSCKSFCTLNSLLLKALEQDKHWLQNPPAFLAFWPSWPVYHVLFHIFFFVPNPFSPTSLCLKLINFCALWVFWLLNHEWERERVTRRKKRGVWNEVWSKILV